MTSGETPAGSRPGGKGPSLLHATRLAWSFVWTAARSNFAISVVAEGVGALGLAGVLLFGQQVVEKLTGDIPIESIGAVLPATIGLGFSFAVVGLASVFVRRYRWLVAEQVTKEIEREVIGVSTSVDYEFYERQDFHDQLNRSNTQVAESSYQMAYDILNVVSIIATTVVVVLVLVRTVPEVLGVLVLIAVPSVLAARASARLAYQTTYQLTPNDRLRLYLYRALIGKQEARELRVFGLSTVLRNRWERLYADRMTRISKLVRRQIIFDGLAAIVGAALVATVLLILVQAAVNQRITVADAAVAIVALQQVNSRLRAAASASGSLRQSSYFLEEFEQFRALKVEESTDLESGPVMEPERLVIDGVSFRYPGTETLVLDDVSFVIEPGEIVALVGESGGGKSTLAHLVAGLYQPSAGTITFGGVDIGTIPSEQYWKSVAAVFQDFVRFELTARENIGMSDYPRIEESSDIKSAAQRAGIDRALEELPAGYETMMSRSYDGGTELSVGQWQRVAVARAFFREAPILILDEPAAALDAVAETRLYERLTELVASRSVLLISHRFSTVRLADRIIVIEQGRIAEQGSHDELIELGGRYSELFNLQASSYRFDIKGDPPTGANGP